MPFNIYFLYLNCQFSVDFLNSFGVFCNKLDLIFLLVAKKVKLGYFLFFIVDSPAEVSYSFLKGFFFVNRMP